MQFRSEFHDCGTIKLPEYAGVRVLQMPFLLEDFASLPDEIIPWWPVIQRIKYLENLSSGVAYLTIDEALVLKGETHRRPGLHVDGVGPDDSMQPGMWGHGNWGGTGMYVLASHVGSRAWFGDFEGWPEVDGDCAHLSPQCLPWKATPLAAGCLYACGAFCVHEALPLVQDTRRQFMRLSLPNDAPWHDGCTENPKGIAPTGLIYPRRERYLQFRPVR